MKIRTVLLALLTLSAVCVPVFAEDLRLDGRIFGGGTLYDYSGESFGAKASPAAGISLGAMFPTGGALFFGIELGGTYNFRSNYNDYYYYDSSFALSLTPQLGVDLPGRSPHWFLTAGAGVSHTFSGLFSKTYLLATAGAGVYFSRFIVDGMQLSYVHGFVKDYSLFESLRVSVIVHLLRGGAKGRKEGGDP
jgi:hypothetical protein